MVNIVNGRTFDYEAHLDPASEDYLIRDHPLTAAAPPVDQLWAQMRAWDAGAVLDQGSEGTCVGHGVVGEYLASPVRGGLKSDTGHLKALEIFDWAAAHDEFAGNARSEGTSVNAGMKAGREQGWWDDYHWAKNMNEFRQGLEFGPIVIGVVWKEKMYETNSKGRVTVGGDDVGGHCLLVTGWVPSGLGGGMFRWRNSWGVEYGLRGNGWIDKEDLNSILFEAGNEAAVATGRHLGRR
jgi:hypothetical protein